MGKDNRPWQTGCGSFDGFDGDKVVGLKEKKCKDCKTNDTEQWEKCHCTPIKEFDITELDDGGVMITWEGKDE